MSAHVSGCKNVGARNSGYEMSRAAQAIQINSIRIPPKKTCASCYPALVNITLRMITYPIRIWCSDGKHWLKWASLATAHVPPLSNGVSGRPVRTSFAMDSKELSSILDYFRDQKALKTPKLNTILLELIVRVLNMLIGLKGDNYYSKVFKRVNYKLSNNTFWVVINNWHWWYLTLFCDICHMWYCRLPVWG